MTIDTAKERARLAALDGHTPAPWHLCAHLKGPEGDERCKCGYRGVIYGPEDAYGTAICQPGHDPGPPGEEGLSTVRYPREIERANAQLIAAAPVLKIDYGRALDTIDAQSAEIDRLSARIAELETANSEQENNDLYTGGNLWRFWADKAAKIAKAKDEEIKRLREAIERAVMTLPDDDDRDDRVTEVVNFLLGVVLGGSWRREI